MTYHILQASKAIVVMRVTLFLGGLTRLHGTRDSAFIKARKGRAADAHTPTSRQTFQ